MNITLYAICKNEEKNVNKFIENSKKFYDTVVIDTGSTDNTVELLRDAGITVYEYPQSVEKFDFSVARNTALSHVDTEWALSLDFNEDIENFNPKDLEKYIDESNCTALMHRRFDVIDDGERESNEIHVRLHKTKNYQWVGAVHEIPYFIESAEQEEKRIKVDFIIKKKVNRSIDKEVFYLSIYERELKKDPDNIRYHWFCFLFYLNSGNNEKTLEYAFNYLTGSQAYFDSHRIYVFMILSQLIFEEKKQDSLNFALHALSESLSVQKTPSNTDNDICVRAIENLIDIGQKLRSPDIVLFATAYLNNPSDKRRKEAIKSLNVEFMKNNEN